MMSCFYCKKEKENESPFSAVLVIDDEEMKKKVIHINRCKSCYTYHLNDMVFSLVFGIIISLIVIFFMQSVLIIGFSFIISVCIGLVLYNFLLKSIGIVAEHAVEDFPLIQSYLNQGAYQEK